MSLCSIGQRTWVFHLYSGPWSRASWSLQADGPVMVVVWMGEDRWKTSRFSCNWIPTGPFLKFGSLVGKQKVSTFRAIWIFHQFLQFDSTWSWNQKSFSQHFPNIFPTFSQHFPNISQRFSRFRPPSRPMPRPVPLEKPSTATAPVPEPALPPVPVPVAAPVAPKGMVPRSKAKVVRGPGDLWLVIGRWDMRGWYWPNYVWCIVMLS